MGPPSWVETTSLTWTDVKSLDASEEANPQIHFRENVWKISEFSAFKDVFTIVTQMLIPILTFLNTPCCNLNDLFGSAQCAQFEICYASTASCLLLPPGGHRTALR